MLYRTGVVIDRLPSMFVESSDEIDGEKLATASERIGIRTEKDRGED